MIALSRTCLDVLFASLWQGAIIAAFSWALLAIAGNRINAATRAVVLQATLGAIIVSALATTPIAGQHASTHVGGYGVVDTAAPGVSATSANGTRERHIDVALDDRAVLAITSIWTLGVLGFGARMLAGHRYMARLIAVSVRTSDERGTAVYVSTAAHVPFATGLLKPAIVLPASLASESAVARDAVILHELAHVRRRDVWFHACERVAEALFFFNPIVTFSLRAISLEREAACDDWAVAQTRDLNTYLHALASFALMRAARPADAYGASLTFGRATISRIRRLEDRRRNGATTLSPTILRGSMLALVSIAIALQLFAPAIAFAPVSNAFQISALRSKCDQQSAYIGGPPPTPKDIPKGNYFAHILVNISATGAVTGVSVKTSSGNSRFDTVAEAVARKSQFSPQRRNCVAIASSYVFQMRQQMNTGE